MTAATKPVAMSHQGDGIPLSCRGLVKANAVLQRGWLCLRDASGFVIEAVVVTGGSSAGLAMHSVDATGAASGDKEINLAEGVYDLKIGGGGDALVEADVGPNPTVVYAMDNQTVGKVATGRSPAGILFGINEETGLARVLVGRLAAAIIASASQVGNQGTTLQTGTVTLISGVKAVTTGVTITAASKIFVTRNTPAGTMGTDGLKVADASLVVGGPGVGAFTITSIKDDQSTETLDTSTVNYVIVG